MSSSKHSPYFLFNRSVSEKIFNNNNLKQKKRQTLMAKSKSLDPKICKDSFKSYELSKLQNKLNDDKPTLIKPCNQPQPQQKYRFQLICHAPQCDKDQILSIYSHGGYSTRSRNPNKHPLHNHKKLKDHTEYDYIEKDIPFIYPELYEGNYITKNNNASKQSDNKVNEAEELRIRQKMKWKTSPFAPVFLSKADNIMTREKQVKHQEERQMEEIAQYEKTVKREQQQAEKKRLYHKQTITRKRQLKIGLPSSNNSTISNPKLIKLINSPDSNYKNPVSQRMRTRNHQRPQQIYRPQPPRSVNFCFPCQNKYEDYWKHIQTPEHKLNLKGLGTQYFEDDMERFNLQKKEQLKSPALKSIIELTDLLRELADRMDNFMLVKCNQLRQKCNLIDTNVKNL